MLSADILEYEVLFRHTKLVGNQWTPPKASRTALLLHGGGNSSAEGFQGLRTFLHERGIETVAFDFVGHGHTGGQQVGTTLDDRVQQALEVVSSRKLEPSSLSLIGFSMGAYIAVKAAVELQVPRLCLAIPAAYSMQAYKVPFGPKFSEVLRAPRSWADSDAFDLVLAYSGHLLVVSAEEDNVIPPEIPLRYASGSVNRLSTAHHIVRRSRHNLSEHYEREPNARMAVYTELASLCLRGDA